MRKITKNRKGFTKIVTHGLINIFTDLPLNITNRELKVMVQKQILGDYTQKEVQHILAQFGSLTIQEICKKYKINRNLLGQWYAVFGKGISFTRINVGPWQKEIRELKQKVRSQEKTITRQATRLAVYEAKDLIDQKR